MIQVIWSSLYDFKRVWVSAWDRIMDNKSILELLLFLSPVEAEFLVMNPELPRCGLHFQVSILQKARDQTLQSCLDRETYFKSYFSQLTVYCPSILNKRDIGDQKEHKIQGIINKVCCDTSFLLWPPILHASLDSTSQENEFWTLCQEKVLHVAVLAVYRV